LNATIDGPTHRQRLGKQLPHRDDRVRTVTDRFRPELARYYAKRRTIVGGNNDRVGLEMMLTRNTFKCDLVPQDKTLPAGFLTSDSNSAEVSAFSVERHLRKAYVPKFSNGYLVTSKYFDYCHITDGRRIFGPFNPAGAY